LTHLGGSEPGNIMLAEH